MLYKATKQEAKETHEICKEVEKKSSVINQKQEETDDNIKQPPLDLRNKIYGNQLP